MAYRFKLEQSIGKGFRRVGLEQIDHALVRLGAKPAEQEVAVHDVRKCMKRLRALLRLARGSVGEARFERENARFRDVAQLLAATRQRHVLEATLLALAATDPDPGSALGEAIAGARRALQAGDEPIALPPEAIGRARKQLVAGRRAFDRLQLAGKGFGALEDGLRRSYASARKAFATAYASPCDESFHELRKHVQHHWRHMLLLRRAWPEVLGARAAAARELSQALGDDHDLADLIAFLEGLAARALPPSKSRLILVAARARQAELRELARYRGEQLLAEEPRAFVARMAAYWRHGRDHRRALAARSASAPAAASGPAKRRRRSPNAPATASTAASRRVPRAKPRGEMDH